MKSQNNWKERNDDYLHRIDEHASKSERDLFGELFARHGHLEAVAEVDVHNLATDATKHQVGRMSVTQAENVTHHRHHCQRPRVVGTSVKPYLTTEQKIYA